MLRGVAFAAVLCVCAAACGDDPGSDPLLALLAVPPPAGYTEQSASGSLGLDAASSSTPADPAATSRELASDGVSRGYARVWVKGDDFITFEVLRTGGAQQAQHAVAFEHSVLASAPGYVTDDDVNIPGSVVYTMFGTTHSGGKNVFCQGVWFPSGRDVFGVTTCSPLPAGATQVEALAEAQHRAARSAPG
jgi:hypothetical protein